MGVPGDRPDNPGFVADVSLGPRCRPVFLRDSPRGQAESDESARVTKLLAPSSTSPPALERLPRPTSTSTMSDTPDTIWEVPKQMLGRNPSRRSRFAPDLRFSAPDAQASPQPMIETIATVRILHLGPRGEAPTRSCPASPHADEARLAPGVVPRHPIGT